MKFRMVDRILDYQPRRRIVGVKTVSFEEYQLKSAFAGPAALPETLLMEAIFQLGNWLIVLSSDFTKMGLLVRLDEVRFDHQPGPGQVVTLQADVRIWRDDGIVFDGLAFVAGRQIAAGRGCLAVPADLADFHDPADLRVLFSEICKHRLHKLNTDSTDVAPSDLWNPSVIREIRVTRKAEGGP